MFVCKVEVIVNVLLCGGSILGRPATVTVSAARLVSSLDRSPHPPPLGQSHPPSWRATPVCIREAAQDLQLLEKTAHPR